jgi:hypothetical protein
VTEVPKRSSSACWKSHPRLEVRRRTMIAGGNVAQALAVGGLLASLSGAAHAQQLTVRLVGNAGVVLADGGTRC